MEKIKNPAKKLGIVLLIMLMFTINVNAADFTNVYLPIAGTENNSKKIVTATKDGNSNSYVKVTTIKKGNGDNSSYKKIWRLVYSGTKLAAEATSVTKGEIVTLSIKSTYKTKGTKLTLNGYGNNPYLDCQVTGVFSAN